ncbi:hypothetical protein [Methanosarcina vacuolata]|uniref:Uncharacterized protein n=1 Tax=Methanosarcina vacuolata Z-761 TaxID=1434123 RepID=A0A0E3Q646_9EURY|nr:hypothetical protein [Methanosarcina vacuolata]AKB45020.1 hypothetical protein MSVAZ_2751 [Methanosarcina vacuolata Z-761]
MEITASDHLKRNEVKAGIIEFIIGQNDTVPEPYIRKHLEKKYGITDIRNMKRHLKDLQHEPYLCIEKVPPKKSGLPNNWDIGKIEHVKNIRLHFPEIQLKKYEKTLKIVLKRFFLLHPDSPMANKFRIQLFLSSSFFDTCIKYYPETVDTIAYELYKHDFDKWGKDYPEWEQRILEDMFLGGAVGLFTEMMKRIMTKLNIPNQAEILTTVLETEAKKIKDKESKTLITQLNISKRVEISITEIIKTEFAAGLKKIKDENSELMSYYYQLDKSGELFEMKLPLYIGPVLIERMFDFCVEKDIYEGTISPEEIEFVNKTKEMHAYYKANPEIDLFSKLKAYDDFYIQYFEKLREKTETH